MQLNTLVAIALAVFSLSAFAGSADSLDPKYQFDGLERVERFQNWSIDGWYPVDKQSLIVRTSPSTAYLLILDRKLHDLRFSNGIAISSTGNTVHERFDTVRTRGRHTISIPVHIAKIYKLKGKAERKLVRAQIRGAG
ncbi:hypothetical protein FKG94_18530 [Exilibacterium tricleocarpae]|uniref:Uncharacterized protein n=1 Tax=Exilibacterium tricleocarpae TaxID=2591008 RepID=A0A545T631_9GAMM|nr:DUF6491 family protein [Exilibacterium tricleocarpae]TQV72686.1 hypothetical protein FKG94_18530 [Exilibacterium tricleocarpae]